MIRVKQLTRSLKCTGEGAEAVKSEQVQNNCDNLQGTVRMNGRSLPLKEFTNGGEKRGGTDIWNDDNANYWCRRRGREHLRGNANLDADTLSLRWQMTCSSGARQVVPVKMLSSLRLQHPLLKSTRGKTGTEDSMGCTKLQQKYQQCP